MNWAGVGQNEPMRLLREPRALGLTAPHGNELPGTAVRLSSDDASCPRDAATRGVCAARYTKWRYHFKAGRTDLCVEEWALQEAQPLPATPPCLVGACAGSAAGRGAFCAYHAVRRGRFWSERQIQSWELADVGVWAQTQTPWLSGYQFSLRQLTEGRRYSSPWNFGDCTYMLIRIDRVAI